KKKKKIKKKKKKKKKKIQPKARLPPSWASTRDFAYGFPFQIRIKHAILMNLSNRFPNEVRK
ncbi:hypothetical protein, partial [Neisseria gonorrhoeae]|uniref:hypothetical protein n=1 Tax=Neisseria gonorrhoeae TaxID=485 RepID=UPI0039BDBC0B